MYQTGDFIVKATTGICRVEKVAPLEGLSKELYYYLSPLGEPNSWLYIPVNRAAKTIRKALSPQEAQALIHSVSQVPEIQVENEKQREQCYRNAVKSNDPKTLLSIIKTLYLRQEELTRRGKKPNTVDDTYFRMAEKLLYPELSLALGCERDQLPALLCQQLSGGKLPVGCPPERR